MPHGPGGAGPPGGNSGSRVAPQCNRQKLTPPPLGDVVVVVGGVVVGGEVGGVVIGGAVVAGAVVGGVVIGGAVPGDCGGVVGTGLARVLGSGEVFPFGFPEVFVGEECEEGGVVVLWGTVEAVSGEDPAGFASTTTDHLPHLSVMFPFT